MKKSVVMIALLLTFAMIATSCTTPTTSITPTPATTSSQSFAPISLPLTAASLGLGSFTQTVCSWSPTGSYLIVSALESTAPGSAESVYLLRLSDRQLSKIMDGKTQSAVLMETPQWAADESFFTVSFYPEPDCAAPISLYYTGEGRLENLTIDGCNPAVSPDQTQLAYINCEQKLAVYTIATEITVIPRPDAIGRLPVWTTNQTVLFARNTGDNPSELDGAVLEQLTALDLETTEYTATYGDKKVYRALSLVQDDWLLVNTGWDDGSFFGLLNLTTNQLKDFGELRAEVFNQDGKLYAAYIMMGDANSLTLADIEQSDYTISPLVLAEQAIAQVASLKSDGQIIYLIDDYAQDKTLVMKNDLKGLNVELASLDGIYKPVATRDGNLFALINDGSELIIFYPTRIA